MHEKAFPSLPRSSSAKRRLRSVLGCIGAILLAPGWARAVALTPSVVVTPVISANITPSFSDIGRVIAIQAVNVVPRITAFIDKVDVAQGSNVKAGDILFTLQTAQYDDALRTAQANLASARAALVNAQLVYQRALTLGRTSVEPQSAVDQALATRSEDQAQVLSAEASVANAALNLSYCTISAPINGRIGAVTLTKGNLVTPSTGTIATINQLDPIRVEFSVSDNSPIVTAAQSHLPESRFSISLTMPDGMTYPEKGGIAFLDNHVSTSTGTLNVYADFPNPDAVLLPGAYVTVSTSSARPRKALLIPIAALQTAQQNDFVLVVGADNKVSERTVKVGAQIGQDFVVKSGVEAGERVIVDGIQKVKNGQAVSVTTEPAAQPADVGP